MGKKDGEASMAIDLREVALGFSASPDTPEDNCSVVIEKIRGGFYYRLFPTDDEPTPCVGNQDCVAHALSQGKYKRLRTKKQRFYWEYCC